MVKLIAVIASLFVGGLAVVAVAADPIGAEFKLAQRDTAPATLSAKLAKPGQATPPRRLNVQAQGICIDANDQVSTIYSRRATSKCKSFIWFDSGMIRPPSSNGTQEVKICDDPQGDWEACHKTCNDVPKGAQDSGSTGCILGCDAAWIFSQWWCD